MTALGCKRCSGPASRSMVSRSPGSVPPRSSSPTRSLPRRRKLPPMPGRPPARPTTGLALGSAQYICRRGDRDLVRRPRADEAVAAAPAPRRTAVGVLGAKQDERHPRLLALLDVSGARSDLPPRASAVDAVAERERSERAAEQRLPGAGRGRQQAALLVEPERDVAERQRQPAAGGRADPQVLGGAQQHLARRRRGEIERDERALVGRHRGGPARDVARAGDRIERDVVGDSCRAAELVPRQRRADGGDHGSAQEAICRVARSALGRRARVGAQQSIAALGEREDLLVRRPLARHQPGHVQPLAPRAVGDPLEALADHARAIRDRLAHHAFDEVGPELRRPSPASARGSRAGRPTRS